MLSFFAYFFSINLLLLDYQSTFSCDSVILQHTSVSPENSRFYHNNYVCLLVMCVFSVSNWNTPIIFELKEGSVTLIVQAEK